jgi:Uncharacterized protein conserved in bacteria (DUF2141)
MIQRYALGIGIALALSACGGAGGGPGTISGQVTGPTGSNLNKTAVGAVLCKTDCKAQGDITNTVGGETAVTTTGSSATYQIPNVPKGTYAVVAVQDTNGSGTLDVGDLLGVVTGVPVPAQNVNIQVQPATAAVQARFANPELLKQLLEGPR